MAAGCAAAATVAGLRCDALIGGGPRPVAPDGASWSFTVPGLALALAGAVLAVRPPRHALTWLLAASGVLACGGGAAGAYASLSLLEHGGGLPLTSLAAHAGGRTGASLALLPPLLLLFFPDGRLPSPRWRRPALASLACTGTAVLFAPSWASGPDALGAALVAGSLVIPLAAFARRFGGATPERRAQLRWMLAAVSLNAALTAVPPVAPWAWADDAAFGTGPVALAAAVLIAVAGHRVVLGRALLYGGLAGAVVGIELAVFLTATTLMNEPLAAILGAGAVAVLYPPLRARLRRSVDRPAAGRGDPHDVVSALARRLAGSGGSGELLADVARTVRAAFRSPYVRVETDRADGRTMVAELGAGRAGTVIPPVARRGVPIGRLALVPRTGPRLPDADQRLLADVVRRAAAARAAAPAEDLRRSRARLVASVAEERRRLRRDLHDGLGPALAAAALKVEAARNLAAGDPAGADRALADARCDLSALLADVRRLVRGLRPPALDHLGLAGAVRRRIGRLDGARPAVTLDVAGDGAALPALPAAVEVAAYRIVCEALANVTRHAAAERCAVRLAAAAGALEVEVVDDGRGITSGAVAGVGLLGMRERAEELGGHCAVTSPPDGGTRVHAVIPYRAAPPRAAELGGAR